MSTYFYLCLNTIAVQDNLHRITNSKLNFMVKKHSDWLEMKGDFMRNHLLCMLSNGFEISTRFKFGFQFHFIVFSREISSGINLVSMWFSHDRISEWQIVSWKFSLKKRPRSKCTDSWWYVMIAWLPWWAPAFEMFYFYTSFRWPTYLAVLTLNKLFAWHSHVTLSIIKNDGTEQMPKMKRACQKYQSGEVWAFLHCRVSVYGCLNFWEIWKICMKNIAGHGEQALLASNIFPYKSL